MSIIVVLFFTCFTYMWVRNDWVCRKRIQLNHKDPETYLKIEPYEYMLFKKFWVWDFNKLIKENTDEH